ncbi:MAG: MaoC family dehydratase [Xanthobacteraceae bacterium]
MRFFEDIVVGERIELGRHTFGAEEIKAFALRYDPQPFHVDEAAARRSHFGRLIASGWHTGSVFMRLNVERRLREAAAMRARGEPVAVPGPSPGFRELKWLKPVYVGDTISFTSEVIQTRRSNSRPGWGLVTSRASGSNQDGEPVLSLIGTLFVPCRSVASTPPSG